MVATEPTLDEYIQDAAGFLVGAFAFLRVAISKIIEIP